jgi:hypothetical protein
MSFSIKFTKSFSISKNAFIDEYREFSGRVYTHPNKEATDENAPRSKKQKLNFSEIKCLWYQVKTFIT